MGRLVYPSGHQYLDEVREAIVEDLAGLIPPPCNPSCSV